MDLAYPWVIKHRTHGFASVIVPARWNVCEPTSYNPVFTRPAILVFPTMNDSVSFREHKLEAFTKGKVDSMWIGNDNRVTVRTEKNRYEGVNRDQCTVTRMTNLIDFSAKNRVAFFVLEDHETKEYGMTLNGSIVFPENHIDEFTLQLKAHEHLEESYVL